jgi:hypothetical protein
VFRIRFSNCIFFSDCCFFICLRSRTSEFRNKIKKKEEEEEEEEEEKEKEKEKVSIVKIRFIKIEINSLFFSCCL